MDREEILKRAQSQSIGLDEREQQMLGVSFGFGAVLMALVALALAAAALLRGGAAYDYAAIVFAYLTGAQAHQYWKTRRRGGAGECCGLRHCDGGQFAAVSGGTVWMIS